VLQYKGTVKKIGCAKNEACYSIAVGTAAKKKASIHAGMGCRTELCFELSLRHET
jgi:hypothetical protein